MPHRGHSFVECRRLHGKRGLCTKRRRINVLQASLDGAARQSSDVGHCRQATHPAAHTSLAAHNRTSPLVTLRAVRVPPQPNRIPVDHADVGTNQSDD
jgi:hypothetical protein